MRHFTALITQSGGGGQGPFEAVTLDLPLPVVTGRSLAEVENNLLTALQHHIDLTCETEAAPSGESRPRPDRQALASRVARVREGRGLILEIPEYLLTRN